MPANPRDPEPAKSENSETREELPDVAGAEPVEDSAHGGPTKEDSSDERSAPYTAQESTLTEETDQRKSRTPGTNHNHYADGAPEDKADTLISNPKVKEGPNRRLHRTDSKPIRPLTVSEHGERISDIQDRLAKAHAADLASDHRHTTDPDRQQWTAERDRIHGQIVREIYSEASAVPCEYRAIIAGGLGGAGKSTVLSEQLGIDRSQYLTINPDDIKEKMARRGLFRR